MSTSELINPSSLPAPSGYSYAVKSEGGITVRFAGHTALNSEGTIEAPGDIARQFEKALSNLNATLKEAGVEPTDFVRIRIYVTDLAAYRSERKRIAVSYRQIFGKHYPAITLVEVSRLWDQEAMIEIEAVAVKASLG